VVVIWFEAMSKRSRPLVVLTLVFTFAPAVLAFAQCKNQSTPLPLPAMRAASESRDFVRFRYSLSALDSLLIRSHEDTETSIGPYDLGFVIKRGGTTLQRVILRKLP
jgi:hypothetical protein